jgi:NAD(P)-dependent dehydrogenase (short-subunit alcohol dehydrogenase family)
VSRLQDKIALVTGGTSGIGLATAKHFVSEGAVVYITGRRSYELQAALSELGDSAIGVQGDMAQLADLDGLFEQIKSTHGRLDIVFANAGRGEFLSMGKITEEHFDETFALNVKGTLFTVQKALPLLSIGASIILNASIAGSKGFAAFSVYAATKAAIRSFARSWSVDLRDRQIRVNAVSPGTIPTPGYDRLGVTDRQMTDFLDAQRAAIPLGRVGTPEEVARTVLFLASSDSSYVNGIELFVDGGVAQI